MWKSCLIRDSAWYCIRGLLPISPRSIMHAEFFPDINLLYIKYPVNTIINNRQNIVPTIFETFSDKAYCYVEYFIFCLPKIQKPLRAIRTAETHFRFRGWYPVLSELLLRVLGFNLFKRNRTKRHLICIQQVPGRSKVT